MGGGEGGGDVVVCSQRSRHRLYVWKENGENKNVYVEERGEKHGMEEMLEKQAGKKLESPQEWKKQESELQEKSRVSVEARSSLNGKEMKV